MHHRVVAWDTWAFAEVVLQGPRANEVFALMDQTIGMVTARDIVAETFNLLTARARSNRRARLWLEAALASPLRIVDPPMQAVAEYIEAHPRADRPSWADMALAYVASQSGAQTVASTDGGFRQLGFDPVFAAP